MSRIGKLDAAPEVGLEVDLAGEISVDDLRKDACLEALKGLLERYVGLVNSGDAGFWDPETEQEVATARAAIALCGGGK